MIAGLYDDLCERAAEGRPIRVALIGAGTFGGMAIRQCLRVPGIELVAVADLDVIRAATALRDAGVNQECLAFSLPTRNDSIVVTADAEAAIASEHVDIVIEATGSPIAAIRHIRLAFAAGKHVVNVTVEADALVGSALAAKAHSLGLTYSMAYGDQPALICELVDWARVNGFDVVSAGKGTLYKPGFEWTSPDTVWTRYGIDATQADGAGYDRRMFTSFVDGTKSAIEMAVVASATGLAVPKAGLGFLPVGIGELPSALRPRHAGGQLERSGIVEVVSAIEADGKAVTNDLRWGVFVVVGTDDNEVARCFRDYGLTTDTTGKFAALWRNNHLVGMELMTSIASVGLLGRPTGVPKAHCAEAVAVAKRDLPEQMEIDGEGGYTVFGKLVPAENARSEGAVPIGLARGLRTVRHVSQGDLLTWEDVDGPGPDDIRSLRESMFNNVAVSA